jgi:hypothetical protein
MRQSIRTMTAQNNRPNEVQSMLKWIPPKIFTLHPSAIQGTKVSETGEAVTFDENGNPISVGS